ncbi:PR domain zinc finger protein 4, partial [Penaeus vannamei]
MSFRRPSSPSPRAAHSSPRPPIISPGRPSSPRAAHHLPGPFISPGRPSSPRAIISRAAHHLPGPPVAPRETPRLYESREVAALEVRAPPMDVLAPAVKHGRRGRARGGRAAAIRIKLCGECGARHVAGTCPFSRPTHVLPDTCPPPAHAHLHSGGLEVQPQQNGVIRPGSPGCYARASLRPGLALERRVPGRQVEVVVARAPITRYTQLGPVVGAPVRERDIPDDFCMVNLWEVFSGEGKRYLSTVDPRRSNWTRYLRPAPDRDSANLVVVPRPMLEPGEETSGVGGNVGGVGVFLITTQDVSVGQELMFWAHDPTLAWSRKKMEKT